MIKFVLVILVYYFFVNQFFDSSVRPVGRKIQRRLIPLPKELISTWILVAGTLFPMMSIVKARQADWQPEESLAAMASFLGVVLGMIVDV